VSSASWPLRGPPGPTMLGSAYVGGDAMRAAVMWSSLRSSRRREATLEWLSWTRAKQKTAARAAAIEDGRAARLVRTAWVAWDSERRRRSAITTATIIITARTARARSRSCLNVWLSFSERSRRIRLGLDALLAAADLRSYRAAINEWRAQAWVLHCKRRGIERIFEVTERRVLEDGILAWATWAREDASEERRTLLAVSHWQSTHLANAVITWHKFFKRRRFFRTNETHLVARATHTRLAMALAVWRSRFTLARLRHGLTKDMRARWLAALARGVMHAWFDAAHRRRVLSGIGVELVQCVRMRSQRVMFTAVGTPAATDTAPQ